VIFRIEFILNYNGIFKNKRFLKALQVEEIDVCNSPIINSYVLRNGAIFLKPLPYLGVWAFQIAFFLLLLDAQSPRRSKAASI